MRRDDAIHKVGENIAAAVVVVVLAMELNKDCEGCDTVLGYRIAFVVLWREKDHDGKDAMRLGDEHSCAGVEHHLDLRLIMVALRAAKGHALKMYG